MFNNNNHNQNQHQNQKQRQNDKPYSSSDDKNLQNVLYVEPTLFGKGQLNPFSTRLTFSNFTINTLFRPNYNTTRSTNFIVDLPIQYSKVAAYELIRFSCNTLFYNISESTGSNQFTIVIQSPPNNLDDIAITIKLDSGIYTAFGIQEYLNSYFRSSNNGLQFLVCDYNRTANKFSFRAFSFWLDGYLPQLIQDPDNPDTDPLLPHKNKLVVLGGGVYDEFIIDPSDPTSLINNPFYKEDCEFIFDFSVSGFNKNDNYYNFGWTLGFTCCTYKMNIHTCKTYHGNPYYNFLNYFANIGNPVTVSLGSAPLTNILYLQKHFDIITSELNVYGFLQADIMFVNMDLMNSNFYFFLDIDDYNKNYNPLNTCSITDGFNSTFSPTTFSKITLSSSGIGIDCQNRIFYGPVDIKRLHIRLLDKYGNELDLNGGDYSFTLHFTSIY